MKKSEIIDELLQEKQMLNSVIQSAQRRLSNAPDGHLRIIKHKKGYQFYHITKTADTQGTYLPVSEKGKAIALMQKKYDREIEAAAKQQLSTLNRFLQEYDPKKLEKVYSTMREERKQFVVPVEITDHEYVMNWLSQEYTPKPFAEGALEHYTSRGQRVRSKSEVMIADALDQAGVAYKYECPLRLANKVIHPDFTILRAEDRKELYWEHLGMMDDSDYINNAIRRIRLYENEGIFPGKNLILSMETTQLPLNHTVIKRLINSYCV